MPDIKKHEVGETYTEGSPPFIIGVSRTPINFRFEEWRGRRLTEREQFALNALYKLYGSEVFQRWNLDAGVANALGRKGYLKQIDRDPIDPETKLALISEFRFAATEEIARIRYLAEIARRPEQASFSERIREAYGNSCAVTDCSTAEVLQAAHIMVMPGVDHNATNNGILLRSDIHALFDAHLITLTQNGRRLQLSALLNDPEYSFLERALVRRPARRSDWPSQENIRARRECFVQHQKAMKP